MDKCKQCGKELTHVDGRKKKQFCDTNCKNKHFYAERQKMIKEAQKVLDNTPAVSIQNLTEGTNNVKPITDPPKVTNKSINTTAKTNPYDQKKDYMRWRQWENANK